MQTIIKNSLKNSYSYSEYRNQVTSLLLQGKVTGLEQSESLTNYTALNEARMNRLEKTISLTEEVKTALSNLKRKYVWLVLSEGWCGDAAQLLPIMHKIAEFSENIEMRVVIRDENEDLMNLFLTNGSKAIPKLVILNTETLKVVSDWGPRPLGAKNLIIDYKSKHGVVDETAKTELQKWYLKDKGVSTQMEIMALIQES
jgi:thiol-disulfide isomerase/thioredoxin